MEEGPLKKELEGAYNSIREQQKQLEEYQRVSQENERVIEEIVKNRN